ncbi:hypothetical protein GYMLUDRAFT_71407 [Collybiopsis luxurians FD-317 M1]|uniref:Unplaced genomic scaffold GYMLUscaffold_14, whole genome shotgun sequence n=1 Tax=Collybiopsis luxurians FD-317 M1 TaxID=944289 RepID=A0A0D0C704_9AGAR|nr:hypothetical protein GYMLUDRAFT_71407 [Collybiopsis luxurians FD-317 M1]
MPIGEHNIMFEESWNSSAILLTSSNAITEKWNDSTKTSFNPPCSVTNNPTGRMQCPMCLRFFPAPSFGRCFGVPTAEFPQSGTNTRKRKRTETRAAHEMLLAPCHDCLDSLGEDEGATWGRCDNAKCWSRRGESLSPNSFFGKPSRAARTTVLGSPLDDQIHFDPYPSSRSNGALDPHKCDPTAHGEVSPTGLGLVCPKCSPEGGLGCAHKWICDVCAFWDQNPLVWECPGCLNDYCDECEESEMGQLELERCAECGKRDLCRACRSGNSPTDSDCDSPRCDLNSGGFSGKLFSWRCWLCSLPVCSTCVPTAHANRRIDSCRNCHSRLCEGCRSVLGCQRCGGEMCQLCLGETLAMLCHKCEHGS